MMNQENDKISIQLEEFLQSYQKLDILGEEILNDINSRMLKLFELPPHKRIFLFILTRAIKTCAAIEVLCRSGYGQDVATLVRSLLENLITLKYILHNPSTADDYTRRFVAYKWVIFKRHLPEQEKSIYKASPEDKKAFYERKQLIWRSVDEFKQKYKITSDRGLLTWSGKTIKDMARQVSKELMEEYESTFRLCSRFSHPSILGEQEYMIQDGNKLTFSPLPSTIGIIDNLKKSIMYYFDFLQTTNQLFELKTNNELELFRKSFNLLCGKNSYSDDKMTRSDRIPPPDIRQSIITFQKQHRQDA